MPCRRSSTIRPITFWRPSRRRVREAAGGRNTLVIAENELQDSALAARAGQRRLRARRGLERRFSSRGPRGDDRPQRKLLRRLSRHAAGTDFGGQAGAICIRDNGTPGSSSRRGTPAFDIDAAQFVIFLAEPRPGRQFAAGQRCPSTDFARPASGVDRAVAAGARHAAVVSGTGVFGVERRFCFLPITSPNWAALVREGRHDGTAAVSPPGGPGRGRAVGRSLRPRDLRAVEARLARARAHTEAPARCIATCCDCAATIRCLPRSEPIAFTAPCWPPRRLLLRYFGDDGDDRLLLVNLGRDLDWQPATEPLLAPPAGTQWRLLWSSEDPRYGGIGHAAPLDPRSWYIPGHAAIVLAPPSRLSPFDARPAPVRTVDGHETDAATRRDSRAETRAGGDPLWYKDAVIYQLHVRSFFDSDDDGIGDFRRADAEARLPAGPGRHGALAVAVLSLAAARRRLRHRRLHRRQSGLRRRCDDFKTFLREAHARGLRVITELVLNHTSDQHPWFQRARAGQAGQPAARLLRLERHAREIHRRADHLQGFRALELDLGSRWPRPTTGIASTRISPI